MKRHRVDPSRAPRPERGAADRSASRRKRRAHRRALLLRALWWCAGLAVAVGLVLRLVGSGFGLVVAAVGLLVFVVAAWIGANPQGPKHTDLDPWAA